MDVLIQQFKLYCTSHPNLSNCWIAYLELKKRHYDDFIEQQCRTVLELLEQGYPDLKEADIIRLLVYKQSLSIY
jgi:hypothetical protein